MEVMEAESSFNMMRFFVNGEGGTTALLAMLLKPGSQHPAQEAFRKEFASLLGLDLPDKGPDEVLTELEQLDLVLVWGKWLIVVENKVAGASIRKGQLDEYYLKVSEWVKQGKRRKCGCLDGKHICMVFLTPNENIGKLEFDLLDVNNERGDKKVPLSWPAVLKAVERAFPPDSQAEPYASVVISATAMTREWLKYHRRSEPKIDTPERCATQKFMDDLEKEVSNLTRTGMAEKLKLCPRWKNEEGDGSSGNVGGKTGLVYFQALALETNLTDPKNGTLCVNLRFWATGKPSKETRDRFATVQVKDWAIMLGVENTDLLVDPDKCRVTYKKDIWNGDHEALLRKAASMFFRFLVVFRPFMVDNIKQGEQE